VNDTAQSDGPYRVAFAEFSGPLDLLLHLVRRQEIRIRDVPLAQITGEYLETIEFLETVDLDPAGEFLELAAALVRIKARSMLPRVEDATIIEEVDSEEADLLQRLVEHQVVRLAAERLRDRETRMASVWFRGEVDPGGVEKSEREVVEADLFALVTAFRGLLADLEAKPGVVVRREDYPVSACADEIRERLSGGRPVPFEELFDRTAARGKLIATFLALLELIRSAEARAFQDGPLGRILVFPPDAVGESDGRPA
jgi:segregation and condensation protein A